MTSSIAEFPKQLASTGAWLFDLDNTLYPAHSDLFAQIDVRMAAFIGRYLNINAEQARQVQKSYWAAHGTTLNGLMREHKMAPEPFLDYVHDIDVSVLNYDPALDNALSKIQGRKIIFTNGTVRHAENVLRQLKLGRHFEAIFDIAATGYVPKPKSGAYAHVVSAANLNPGQTIMIDDSAKNLLPAHQMGMTTIWATGKVEWSGPDPDPDVSHIHHTTDDLAGFLAAITRDR
ncbi:unnamed protein product [Phaeothamnion confervicola]